MSEDKEAAEKRTQDDIWSPFSIVSLSAYMSVIMAAAFIHRNERRECKNRKDGVLW